MESNISNKKKRYRRGVGMVIINTKNKIFIGQRFDKDKSAWQMPQGGIDKGESSVNAVIREMKEETGILKNYEIIYESKMWHYYNLPKYLNEKLWKGRFIGQKQKWFVIKFTGKDNEINIRTKKPEFKKWEWSTEVQIMNKIVNFKKKLYKGVFDETRSYF